MIGYLDHADRARRRAALYCDPAWLAFAAKAAPMLSANEGRLLAPAPFFRDNLARQLAARPAS